MVKFTMGRKKGLILPARLLQYPPKLTLASLPGLENHTLHEGSFWLQFSQGPSLLQGPWH